MKPGPGLGVELADHVADHVAVLGAGVDPPGDGEPVRSPLQGRMVLHFQEGIPPIEPRRSHPWPWTGFAQLNTMVANSQTGSHGLV
jgi:hypothetical protein